MPRGQQEFVNLREPAMPDVQSWAAEAGNRVEFLPVTREAGERTLLALQVTTRLDPVLL